MRNISNAISTFINDEEGLTTVEYAVAGALVIGAVIAAFIALGGAVAARLDALAAIIA